MGNHPLPFFSHQGYNLLWGVNNSLDPATSHRSASSQIPLSVAGDAIDSTSAINLQEPNRWGCQALRMQSSLEAGESHQPVSMGDLAGWPFRCTDFVSIIFPWEWPSSKRDTGISAYYPASCASRRQRDETGKCHEEQKTCDAHCVTASRQHLQGQRLSNPFILHVCLFKCKQFWRPFIFFFTFGGCLQLSWLVVSSVTPCEDVILQLYLLDQLYIMLHRTFFKEEIMHEFSNQHKTRIWHE